MPSIHDIVYQLNMALIEPLSSGALNGSEINGIAITVQRKNSKGEDEKLPSVMNKDGEGYYVGIDDGFPVRLYHKIEAMTSSIRASAAMGRSPGEQVNTYLLGMVVFLNRKITKLFADELVLLIQSVFPDTVVLEPFTEIKILFNRIILNDMQVYNEEYLSTTYRLLPEHNLFKIFYNVEASFKKGCFNNCEDLYN